MIRVSWGDGGAGYMGRALGPDPSWGWAEWTSGCAHLCVQKGGDQVCTECPIPAWTSVGWPWGRVCRQGEGSASGPWSLSSPRGPGGPPAWGPLASVLVINTD